MRLEAPAKLNLALRVVGRRADGFHLLESEVVLLELADRLLLMPGSVGLRVEALPDDEVPLDRRNLAWRGLVAGVGEEPDLVCLTLEKRIPSAAGLGGGSSDAAAAWRLGRRCSGADERPGPAEMASLATIGADVPFFAAQVAAARVGGIGEQVDTSPLPPQRMVVLVHPPFRLETGAVFAELRPSEWGSAAGPDGNDLHAPARRLRPALDDIFALVLAAGGVPSLTGSGPTVFARTDDAERVASIAARLRRAGVRVTETRIRREPASIELLHEELEDA
jgi:4-diphosphocytidyl-2-C-methyl-D-erythritol kinase